MSLHLPAIILPNTPIPSMPVPALRLAGVSSDFDVLTCATIIVAATTLCVTSYLSLSSHRLSKAQLESNKVLKIQYGKSWRYRIPGWLRTAWHLFCKIGIVSVAYYLASSVDRQLVIIGLVLSVLFIAHNSKQLFDEVINPRSVFQRRFLLFRIDPKFVRHRLFFDLGRRLVYFVIWFSFLSYSLHRLWGNLFSGQIPDVSLFVTHLQSNLYGITSFGNDPLSYTHTLSMLYQIFRTVFSFLLFVIFASLVIKGITSSTLPKKARGKRETTFAPELNTRADVQAFVSRIVGKYLKISRSQIKGETDLIRDFRTSEYELSHLQSLFEEGFEIVIEPSAGFGHKTKVCDIVEFFWHRLEAEKRQLKLPLLSEK